MSALTGNSVAATYKDLLQVSNSNSGIDGTLRTVSDGEATASSLELSSTAANFTGTVTISSNYVYRAGGTDIPVLDGGTGASTAADARTNLGLAIGTNVQAYDVELAALAGLTSAADKVPYFTGSGTADVFTVTTAARTVLDDASVSAMVDTLGGASSTGTGGLVRATSPTFITPVLGAATVTSINGLTITSSTGTLTVTNGKTVSVSNTLTFTGTDASSIAFGTGGTVIYAANNLSDLASASTARTNLGLGSIATQASSSVSISGGSITGITDLAIADGGTGSSTAADARTALGIAIGSDVQAYDATLASIAALGTASDKMAYTTGVDTWAETPLTSAARTVLDDTTVGAMVDTLGGASSTGTGGLVRATSATLITPLLGTPTSGTLTNCSGLPISTGVSGLGSNVATFLATPSSSNLASAVTDESGSGALVFATSPTLVTPTLGVAVATSLSCPSLITASNANLVIQPNGTGQITTPSQAAFSAYLSTTATNVTGDGTTYTVICDTESIDVGSNYDHTTGVFTAPVTGLYVFSCWFSVTGLTVAHTRLAAYISAGSSYYTSYSSPYSITSDGTGTIISSGSAVVYLTASTTVSLKIQVSGGTLIVDLADTSTRFSGYFLG